MNNTAQIALGHYWWELPLLGYFLFSLLVFELSGHDLWVLPCLISFAVLVYVLMGTHFGITTK